MKQKINLTKIDPRLVTTKAIFTITLIVLSLTIMSIWLSGMEQHRTVFINSILSTSILSTAFFLFITIGLYKGIKLKDDIGEITDKLKFEKIPNFSDSLDIGTVDLPMIEADGIEGIFAVIGAIILWIFASFLFLFLLWMFGTIGWAMLLVFAAMLYWIFFRALRLVFKNSNKSKGDLKNSLIYGFSYTLLYNFWIYGIILIAHYLS